MTSGLLKLFAAISSIALVLHSSPALAHQKHKEAEQQRIESDRASNTIAQDSGRSPAKTQVSAHGDMGEAIEEPDRDRSSISFGARLLDWLGRLHPIIVHFPIAFFPAALATAIVGRRRPAFATPVRFLVLPGGIIAPVAAILGWLDAIDADGGTLLSVHQWLGTAIGLGGLALAAWAVRRPDQDRSIGMLTALSLMTVAIAVQGWFGGALVHGIDHMNW